MQAFYPDPWREPPQFARNAWPDMEREAHRRAIWPSVAKHPAQEALALLLEEENSLKSQLGWCRSKIAQLRKHMEMIESNRRSRGRSMLQHMPAEIIDNIASFLQRPENSTAFPPGIPDHSAVNPLTMPVSYPTFNPWHAYTSGSIPRHDPLFEETPADCTIHSDLVSLALTCRAVHGPVYRVLYRDVYGQPALFYALNVRPELRSYVRTLHLQGHDAFKGLRLREVFPNLERLEVSQPWELKLAEPGMSLAVHVTGVNDPDLVALRDSLPKTVTAPGGTALRSLSFVADRRETFQVFASIVSRSASVELAITCTRYSPMTFWLLALATCRSTVRDLTLEGGSYDKSSSGVDLVFDQDVDYLRERGLGANLRTIRMKKLAFFARWEQAPAKLALDYLRTLHMMESIHVDGPAELCQDVFTFLPARLRRLVFNVAGHFFGLQSQHKKLIGCPSEYHYLSHFYEHLARTISSAVRCGDPVSHVVLRGPRKRWSMQTPILSGPLHSMRVPIAILYTAETEIGAEIEVYCRPEIHGWPDFAAYCSQTPCPVEDLNAITFLPYRTWDPERDHSAWGA